MKQKIERVMKNKKMLIGLTELAVVIGIIAIFCLLMIPKDRVPNRTHSYSKEEVTEYKIVGNYITRVMPLTEYETFKEIATTTLNNASEDANYTLKVYKDAEKTEEVTEGYIASGMIVETTEENTGIGENTTNEVTNEVTKQTAGETTETAQIYKISVIGDMTGDGDINVTELTKIIKGVVGLTGWDFTEEEKLSADISGDKEVDVVDIELCINYIVFGELDLEEPEKPEEPDQPDNPDNPDNPDEPIQPEEPTNKYTVTFKGEDGTVIITNTYEEGETVEIPEAPVKAEDERYTYEFDKWEPAVEEIVTKDAEYTATYKAIEKEYTVVFKNYDDSVIITNKYHYGDTVSVPANPVKPEDNTYTYEFIGWDKEVTEVTGNVEYKAQYNAIEKEYTVVFKNYDGEEISSKKYGYGATVEVPETPAKPEDNTYTYEFIGWDKEVTEVTGNTEYKAQYKSIYKKYTVVFKNYDDSVIITNTYHYGDTVSIPANPVKPEDERCTYEFDKWEPEVEETVTKNAEYKAQYKETLKEYTVVFKDYDGRVISSKTYNYDAEIEVPENPERAEDNKYTYEFAGWDKEITTVKGNIEYTATYINKYKNYTVVFKNDNGTVINSTDYHYGDTVILPEEPVKESTIEYAYTFTGWTPEVQETVTGNAEYTAIFKQEEIKYSITFYNDDGVTEVDKIEGYKWGDDFVLPTNPTKEPTEETYYVFSTWRNLGIEEISKTEKSLKLVAEYREEKFVARVEATETLEGISYLSLEEAIENAGNEERTVRLLQDTEESIMIEDNQNIILNLNGKTVTGTKNYAIKNYGILVVTDESEEKAGKIVDIVTSEIGYGIHNKEGQVTIKEGTIVTETSQERGATYGIYNQGELPLVIEGGSVIAEAKGKGAISAGIYNLLGKEIQVTGGYVLGNALGESSTGYGIYNATEGKVNVTNGRVEGKTALASATSYGIYNEISQEVTISGGTVAAQSDKSTAYGVYNKEGKITVTEGNIEVTAATGYGLYNEVGTIENQAGKVTMLGTISYGIYNNAGTINVSGGITELTSPTSYGVYNNNQMNITGGEITNKTNGSTSYGIYNNSNKDLTIQNVNITDLYYGIYNNTGKIEVTNSSITASTGIYNNTASANTIVNSAQITATTNGVYNNQGDTNIKSANISSNQYGIYNYYGNVTIEDANIESKQYGVYNSNTGNITIGTKDQSISTEQPSIYGQTNAVYNEVTSSGQVKYYDGILTGKSVIYGGINEIEENSEIVVTTNEEGNEVAILQEVQEIKVAKIGEIEYTTLADAVEAVAENSEETTTIEIIADFEISKVIEIPENKNVTIDLAGHEVKTYAKGGITNKGTLEITDSTEETSGKIISNIGIGISNEGNVKLTKGTIESNNYGIYNYEDGNVVVNGGTIQAKSYGIYNLNQENITVTDGLIKGKSAIRNISSGVNITIKGGILETTEDNYYAIVNNSGIINIEGGEIEGIYGNYGTINISGGMIKSASVGIHIPYFVEINITGGKIISDNSYAIEAGSNTSVNVTGGEIKGKTGIKNINTDGGAIITIGTKDGNVTLEKPIIIGEEYGVDVTPYSNSKIVNFKYYDGKIYGKTEAILGSITELEEGKKVQLGTEAIEEQEYKVASLVDEDVYENGIAQIGENVYTAVSSLKQAISQISTNTEEPVEVKILNNFEMTQEIIIASGQNVKIDLNGKTITSTAAIVNSGTLEITDSTELHEGKFINTSNDAIINGGSLTVTKGNIEAARYGIYLRSSNVILGTEDGEVDNTAFVIKGESYAIGRYTYASYTAKMYDGILKGKSSSKSYVSKTEEGYKVYDYYEGNYYITAIKLESPIARTGGVDYNNLQTAIDNCENGGTVEILRDVDNIKNTVTIAEGQNITLNLEGHTITSNAEKFFVNNGTLNITSNLIYYGEITTNNTSNDIVLVENNGELNLSKGTIDGHYGTAVKNSGVLNVSGGSIYSNNGSGIGIAVENNGQVNVAGGTISGNNYGIKNNETATLTISSGTVKSYQHAIYNNSTNTINITGGKIGNSNIRYAIYNNVTADINITGGSIEAGVSNSDYGYGIYNNGNGNILISTPNTITVQGGYGYAIYNSGEGKVTLEEGSITVTADILAYGIKNASKGKIEVTGGSINTTSATGEAYGIENGTLGTVDISNGSIIANTTTGKAYGIKNMSVTPLIIKQGTIKATGAESYGINNLTSDLVIGEKDTQVSTNTPLIESDNIGIYINDVGSKFSFYDGQVIGEQSINTDANTEEGYKVIKQYSKEKQKEVATITELDNYVLTYYLNGKPYDSVILKEGNKIPELKDVNEEGYEFSGWQDMPTTMPAEDTNIYGMLTPKTYTITYYVDGVQYGEVETYEYKSEITPRELPVNEGREFSGWQNLPETMPAQNLEVRGVFTYTATFYSDKDKTSIIATVPFTINDTSIQEPEIPKVDGYIEYWSEYEIKAEDIEIYIVYVEGNKVLNRTKEKSYDTVEEAMAEVDTDGTENNIILRDNVVSLAKITVPQGANVVLDLNSYTITNTSTYCGIDNCGTLTIEDNSKEQTGTIRVKRGGTGVYGIYNRANANVTIKSGTIIASQSSSYAARGILNCSNSSTITLGVKDGVVRDTNPKIQGVTYGIDNTNGTVNFYDGQVIGRTSINGQVINTEYKYTTRKTTNSSTNLELCYLDLPVNGDKLKATDENGVTWNYTYQDEEATNVYYERGTLPEELTIPSELNRYPVVSLYNSSGGEFRNIFTKTNLGSNTTIKKIIIPDSVTIIGCDAFYACKSLESIEIPNSVTSIKDNTFNGCSSLTEIVIPDSVTSIGDYAFYRCSSLTEIEIPDSVTSIGPYAFSRCSTLRKIAIPDSVTSIGWYAFKECSSLTNINIPDSVTSIGWYAFKECSSLTNINIPDSVTSIGDDAFSGCSSLERINIPDGVTWIGTRTFSGCSSLTEIVIPDSVTIIYTSAFDGCTGLRNVTIGNSVTSIGPYAFRYCSGLTSINIPDSVTKIGNDAFYGCSSLEKINIPDGVTSIESCAFLECSSLESIIIPDSVTSIGYSAFYRCSSLTEIVIPEGVTSIGDGTFEYCSSLTSINIPDSVTYIGQYVFLNCIELTSIEIPNSVTSIEKNAFDGCNSLISVTIGEIISNASIDLYFSNYSNLKTVKILEGVTNIGNDAFSGCSSLESIDIPGGVTSIGYSAFYECSSLTSIEIPDSVTSIGNAAFSGCSSLESIDMPGGVTSIGDSAFYGCSSLTSIEIPKGLKTIGNQAFYRCSSLTEIVIPDSVTSIGEWAFSGCSSLISIDIPSGVTSIGKGAFEGCSSLTSIVIPEGVTSIGKGAFDNTAWYNNQPDGLVCIGKILYNYKGSIPGDTKIEIPDSVTGIGDGAFLECSSLKQIVIPDSVTSIGNSAFDGCSSLTEVVIPYSVTSIGEWAFYGCSSLTSIVIPEGVTSIGTGAFDKTEWYNNQLDGIVYAGKVAYKYKGTMNNNTSIILKEDTIGLADHAFYKCSSLTSINIPDGVTNIGDYAFSGCKGLTSIEIPDSVTSLRNDAFYGCSSLTNIRVDINNKNYSSQDGVVYDKNKTTLIICPNGREEIVIPDGVTSISNDAFRYCSGLHSITIGKIINNKELRLYFSNYKNIKTVKIIDGVTSIGESAFEGCSSLTSIEIPDSVTSIRNYAFRECSSLTSINIPDSVTSIGNYAFSGCSSLTEILIPDSVTKIYTGVFEGWTSDQTIYIEADRIPERWSSSWNEDCYAKIVYGYTGE